MSSCKVKPDPHQPNVCILHLTTQIVNIYFQKKQGNQLLLQKVVRYSLISETSKELGFLNQIEWQNLGFFQSSQCIPFCNI
jgi:hypothetical protein